MRVTDIHDTAHDDWQGGRETGFPWLEPGRGVGKPTYFSTMPMCYFKWLNLPFSFHNNLL